MLLKWVMCMARNPKQDANLVKFTEKTAREMGKRGNAKSQRVRKALKTFKEVALDDLTEDDQKATLKALRIAMRRGYLPAIEFYLKLIGQHPDQGNGLDKTIDICIHGGDEYGD